MLRFFFYLFVSCAIATGQAQSFDEHDFVLYSTKDGLTNNRITSLLQDPYGYMWIATQKGLNRYDGSDFLHFYGDSNVTSLPNEHVRELKLTKTGKIGMRTDAGLHLIDPENLEEKNIFVPAGALKISYIENKVHGWESDEAGNTFLLTSTGFYHFDAKGELAFRYDHYNEEDIKKLDVPFGRSHGIITAQTGILLLATTAGTYIYHIEKKEFRSVGKKDNKLFQQIDPEKKWVHFMHSDKKSFSVVREQATELAWYDLTRNKKYPIKTTLTGLNRFFGWPTKMTRLNDSTFAVNGKTKGFYLMRYDKTNDEYHIQPRLHLGNYWCRAIFLDNQSRLWVGTDRGLLRQKLHIDGLEKVSLPAEKNPLGRPVSIFSIAVAGDHLFAATAGAGVYVFDRNTLRFLKQVDLSSLTTTGISNHVYQLLSLSNDSIYAATVGPLVGIHVKNLGFRPMKLPDLKDNGEWISWQHLSSNKTWYVSTSKSNVFYYRRAGEQKFSKADFSDEPLFNILTPMRISEDPQGNIWFGGHGASRFNISRGKFDLLLDSFPKIKTERKEVNQIAFDKNGNMYFSVEGNGLMIYDPVKKAYEHFTRSEGLPDNVIDAMYLHNGKLWLGTESGLANYDIHTKKISAFGIADNMPEGGVTALSFFYDSLYNQLYAGFNNTVVRFNPDNLTKNEVPPHFYIQSIRMADSSVVHYPAEKLTFGYKSSSFVVNLASVNFEDAHQQRFAYRLVKDGNEPWVETGNQRTIIFSNLAPGNYMLQVKVFVKNNSWPQQLKELAIVVDPPFYKRWWVIILLLLLILLALWRLFKTRADNIRRKEALNTQIAELEMKGLHAQMNPHFVFNALNSIKEMVLTDEKKSASRYLSKFAQLIRTNLEQSRQTFVTLQQSVEHLRQYLEMEKIRFRDFSFSIDVDEDLDADTIKVPPMLLQPLSENAIWHGLHGKEGNKHLTIHFFKANGLLICTIEDNGIGYLQSLRNKQKKLKGHHSIGIANIHERLDVLNEKYGINCSLSIKDKSESTKSNETGTIATLQFKL